MGTFRILLKSPLVFKSTRGRFSPIPIHYLSRFPHEEMHSRSCFWSFTHSAPSRRYPAKVLNDLNFADDIALLESFISQAPGQQKQQIKISSL